MQVKSNSKNSLDLQQIDKKLVWHPFTPLEGADEPLLIQSAEGIYLNTPDGRKIIDAISSWWVNLHGHSNPVIADAIFEQARKLEHVIFAGFTHEPAIQLSQNLISILPENQRKIFFSDNGSTAVEVGLKMAMQYWHNQGITRKTIIALEDAYHGDTFGSMSVGGRSLFTSAFSSYLFDVEFIPCPIKGNEQEALNKFKELVKRDTAAAFIFEPLVQAAGGMKMYDAAILDELIEIAHSHDVVCIADEVFTGFGRTGKLFASDYLSHKPDIIALSKGITGGTLPLGVTSCAEKIVKAFETNDFQKTFFHGHSYTANPITCAAANASFSLLVKPSCIAAINMIERQHKKFKTQLTGYKGIKDVRVQGTILTIELHHQEGTSYTNPLRKKIYPFFLERNILLRPLGNVLYVMPPYVITEQELELIYHSIEEFINMMEATV
jgi:adenosylmethionine-8-amino-7-oxononanoate aminotransferase